MIPQSWEVPEPIRIRFGKTLGRQRSMGADGHLVIILHKVPEPDALGREAVVYWCSPNNNWRVNQRGAGLPTLIEHVEKFSEAVVALEEVYEKGKSSSDFFAVLELIAPMDRAAKNQLQALQSAREIRSEDQSLVTLRDRAAEVSRMAELLHADARNALDYTVARQAEEQATASQGMARAGHRLNVLMAVFLPLTALGSMLGMNMRTGLESQAPWVFWLIFVAGIVVGVMTSLMLMGSKDTAKS